jgi:hypothetical protein
MTASTPQVLSKRIYDMSFKEFTPNDFATLGGKAKKISRMEPSTATLLDDLANNQPIEVHGLVALVREVLTAEASERDAAVTWRLSVVPAMASWITPEKTEVTVEVVRYDSTPVVKEDKAISGFIRQVREELGNWVDQDQLQYVAKILTNVVGAKCHGLEISGKNPQGAVGVFLVTYPSLCFSYRVSIRQQQRELIKDLIADE